MNIPIIWGQQTNGTHHEGGTQETKKFKKKNVDFIGATGGTPNRNMGSDLKKSTSSSSKKRNHDGEGGACARLTRRVSNGRYTKIYIYTYVCTDVKIYTHTCISVYNRCKII
jgi:hypothetical protein